MYQYAAARALSLKHKTDLFIDMSHFEKTKFFPNFRSYQLNFFNIEHRNEVSATKMKFFKEKSPFEFDPEFMKLPDNIYLYGCFQFVMYFEDYADQIRSELTLKNSLSDKSRAYAEKFQREPNSVSVHVRRGDYLTAINRQNYDLVKLDYYDRAINILRENFPDLKLFIFSNDLPWCRKVFNYDVPMEFIEGNDDDHGYEDMVLMSLCKHHIIAN